MIFTYQYVEHDIEKLQEFLDFLFYDVWLVAEGDFDIEKLNGNSDLKRIYAELGNIDYDPESTVKNKRGKSAFLFNSSVEKIFKEFSKIDDDDFKLELIDFYEANNNIDSLCKEKSKKPVCYDEIKLRYPALEVALKNFYSKLYSKESPFNLEIFGNLNKKLIPSHYKAFMEVNDDGICPFCGIHSIDGNYVSTRDAYDHYLPQAIYPLNSINFKNLSPMCYKCNSGNKSSHDPIEHVNGRQLAFYPYSTSHPDIIFKFELMDDKIDQKMIPENYKLSISCDGNQEEMQSWRRIFKIDTKYKTNGDVDYYGRYDELICNKHSAVEWYRIINDEFENATCLSEIEDAEKYFEKVIRGTTYNYRSVANTIKRAFLEECKKKGIFDIRL